MKQYIDIFPSWFLSAFWNIMLDLSHVFFKHNLTLSNLFFGKTFFCLRDFCGLWPLQFQNLGIFRGPLRADSQNRDFEGMYSDQCPYGTGPQTPQPHPAVLPHLRRFETPEMAQSNGCLQEALGTGWDTAANCGLCFTHQTDDLAWTGTQKKKKTCASQAKSATN